MPMCLVTVHRPLPVRHNAPTERRSAGTNRNQRLNRITALTKRARSGKKRRKRKRKRKHQPRKSMWRRVTSLSPLLLSPKPTLLDRAGHGLQSLEPLSTQIPPPVKEETSSAEKTPFITFVLGGPGSGKGTQCIKIAETFGFTHLSAGDLLRNEMLSTSEYGAMILDKMRKGKIVPSEVTVKLLQREMESSSNHKFLIDGFPRSEENRVAYERIIGAEPNMVLFFDCPEEEMIKRVLNRNQGRVDDKIDIVKKRLKVFEALTLPVINYYSKKGKLYKINAVGTVDEIFEQVHPVFAECKANK